MTYIFSSFTHVIQYSAVRWRIWVSNQNFYSHVVPTTPIKGMCTHVIQYIRYSFISFYCPHVIQYFAVLQQCISRLDTSTNLIQITSFNFFVEWTHLTRIRRSSKREWKRLWRTVLLKEVQDLHAISPRLACCFVNVELLEHLYMLYIHVSAHLNLNLVNCRKNNAVKAPGRQVGVLLRRRWKSRWQKCWRFWVWYQNCILVTRCPHGVPTPPFKSTQLIQYVRYSFISFTLLMLSSILQFISFTLLILSSILHQYNSVLVGQILILFSFR